MALGQTAAIRRRLPPFVAFAGDRLESTRGGLFPEEATAVERAVPKRQNEFRAGRIHARAALATLGEPAVAIRVGPDRVPLWPSSTVGSISHCATYCGAALARRSDLAGIGFDVEEAEPPLSAGLIRRVCADAELVRNRAAEAALGFPLPKLIFSIKESVYKCYFPLAGSMLEFDDVEVEIDAVRWTFTARLRASCPPLPSGGRELTGCFGRAGNLLFACTTLSHAPKF